MWTFRANIHRMHPIEIHALTSLGVIRIDGPDAASFLQAQVTADLRGLAPGTSTLAAWCSPQGRVIALLRIGPFADGYLAVLPRELCGSVHERLRRFVLRSRVAITDVSADLAVVGISGREPGALDALPPPGELAVLRLPASRELLIGTAEPLSAATAGLDPAGDDAWEARCIAEGEPEVYVSTSESWVPQMLNLDLLGAVSFRKGCYPGQEIVARTQNLGRIKRRMFRYHVAGPSLPAAGAGLFLGKSKGGEVVRSARRAATGQLLAVVSLDAAGVGLTDETGEATCSPEPLPYAVPEAGEAVSGES
jgi:folate-binding protein YgfZ